MRILYCPGLLITQCPQRFPRRRVDQIRILPDAHHQHEHRKTEERPSSGPSQATLGGLKQQTNGTREYSGKKHRVRGTDGWDCHDTYKAPDAGSNQVRKIHAMNVPLKPCDDMR